MPEFTKDAKPSTQNQPAPAKETASWLTAPKTDSGTFRYENFDGYAADVQFSAQAAILLEDDERVADLCPNGSERHLAGFGDYYFQEVRVSTIPPGTLLQATEISYVSVDPEWPFPLEDDFVPHATEWADRNGALRPGVVAEGLDIMLAFPSGQLNVKGSARGAVSCHLPATDGELYRLMVIVAELPAEATPNNPDGSFSGSGCSDGLTVTLSDSFTRFNEDFGRGYFRLGDDPTPLAVGGEGLDMTTICSL